MKNKRKSKEKKKEDEMQKGINILACKRELRLYLIRGWN